MGFEVVHIEDSGYSFKYQSFFDRISNAFHKLFLKDNYKKKLYDDYVIKRQFEILNTCQHFDNALVIRADFFSMDLIETVRPKVSNFFSFHFDGIDRDKSILEYANLFDDFYVFDEADLKKAFSNNWKYSTNFYIDYPGATLNNNSVGIYYDVYYVSFYHESRIEDVVLIHKTLKGIFKSVKFIVFCRLEDLEKLPSYVKEEMEITQSTISYDEQLTIVANSAVIIDLVLSEHRGWSFRLMESIQFEKKVITTNDAVINADFYNPNNIFVLTKENHGEIAAFLKIPYQKLPESIVRKYGFTEWLESKITNGENE